MDFFRTSSVSKTNENPKLITHGAWLCFTIRNIIVLKTIKNGKT